VVRTGTGAVQVHKRGYMKNVLSTPLSLDMEVNEALLARIRSVEGVVAAAPRLSFSGLVNVGDETVTFAGTGVDPESERKVTPKRWQSFTEGSKFDSADGILLNKDLVASIGGKRGAEAALLAPDRDGALNAVPAVLTGTTLPTGGPTDGKVGLVPLALAQSLLRMEGRATEIAVSVQDLARAPEVAERISKALGPEYEVNTWDQVATFVKESGEKRAQLLGIISSIFMLLMLLGVANTLLMTVLERTREVGTMMAVGVKRSWILGLFLAEALLLGAFGSGLGAALGAGITAWLGHRGLALTGPMNRGGVPFDIRPWVSLNYILAIIAVASIGAVIAALYPAFRASRLRPVQALANG
jgi:putative ABC transport system permease protein